MNWLTKLVGFVFAVPLFGHDAITTKLTWSQEISRLANRHCVVCHREGGQAFSLTSYDEARPWAKAIRDEVLGRRMPPWGPVKGVGQFHDDPSLSIPEIDMVVTWVEGGAPEGDRALLPSRSVLPTAGAPLRFSRTLEVHQALTLGSAVGVVGLRPTGLQDHQSLEAWATLPDGTVERLIWLKDFRVIAAQDYRLSKRLRLPPGTRIQVAGPPNVSLMLLSQ